MCVTQSHVASQQEMEASLGLILSSLAAQKSQLEQQVGQLKHLGVRAAPSRALISNIHARASNIWRW